MIAGSFDIKVQQGVTAIVPFSTDAGVFPDYTTMTFTAKVRTAGGNEEVFSPTVTVQSATTATVTISAAQSESLSLDEKYIYFVNATKSGISYGFLRGSIIVIRGDV